MGNQNITLPLDVLLDTLPITATWTIQKTADKDPSKRFIMSFSETIKGRVFAYTKYGYNERHVAAQVVTEIKGLLTDREENEPD